MIKGVFFDLDGTLADTAPDLAAATNQLLANKGKPALPFEQLRPFVSGGSPALIKIALGITPEDVEFDSLKKEFLDIYARISCVKTQLFDGIEHCLNSLESQNIIWGIITNKPEFLTFPLLEDLKLDKRSAVTICGDTYAVNKPDPYPLVQACQLTNVAVENAIYIGDDERDIIAAKAANMVSVCAEWGYLSGQDPKTWQADHYVKQSTQLCSFIDDLLTTATV